MLNIDIRNNDCLIEMETIADQSIDMILCDLPYGTTQNKWDSVIPFESLWEHYKRICKGAIVLTATQPFSSALVMSNPSLFKYEWVWSKSRVTGALNAKKQPLRCHEVALVFYAKQPTYNAQGVIACSRKAPTGVTAKGSSANYGAITQTTDGTYKQTATGYPRSVLEIPSEGKTVHPTQKPVALMEYLIRTYTNEGDVVLDNCMGSGTTGVACVNSVRHFIGIEKDPEYFLVAEERIDQALRDSETPS